MTVSPLLIERTVAGFRKAHGLAPQVLAFAPGRVNLIGEHTDYNDGFALPCALEFGTLVALSPRDDGCIHAAAIDLGDARADFAIGGDIARLEAGHWQNHLRGIAAGLPRFGLPVSGANLAIAGDIAQGTGLSSSASLGVALALGLTTEAGEPAPDPLGLARTAQWSEHHYVDCACGLMDQLAAVHGQPDCALLLDCRTLDVRPVPFPAEAAVMIVQSGVARGLVDSAYNERRAQCAAAAAHYGLAALRDLDRDRLEDERGSLDETAFRRARHVVTENARTLAAARALAGADLVALGEAMRASHASLRDDFEVSVAAVDSLVDCLNLAIGEQGGARMTGGGFGGCVVAILARDRVGAVLQALDAHWLGQGMARQMALVANPSRGAHILAG